MKVKIFWIEVDELNRGHGVEIRYNSTEDKNDPINRVAFVVGFGWWHNTSDYATVQILQTKSETYAMLGVDLDGKKVKREVQRAVRKYVPDRQMFPLDKPISKHLIAMING